MSETITKSEPNSSRRTKYGLSFPEHYSALDIELYCFRVGRSIDSGGLGKAEHFWKVIAYLYGWRNPVGNRTKYFIRNPWSEQLVDALCTRRYVAAGGCAGSTKSETCALWLLVNFLANSRHTLGIMLSTSLKEARKRIWGSMVEFVNAVPSLPLKVIDSQGIIRYNSPTFVSSDKCSLALVAAERKQEKEAIGKLIGMHNDLVIVIADELSELTESILEYAMPGGNLTSNPNYQFVGLANPPGYFDPFAKLWRPKKGWLSITAEDDSWETDLGIGLHFDGTRSPNILEPDEPYKVNGIPFLPTKEKIEDAKKAEGGENSLRFWRMIRGFPCATGQEDMIYYGSDIVKYKADTPAVWGDQPVTKVAACDPGFTNGGDRSVAFLGTVGVSKDGIRTLQFEKHIELVYDVTVKVEGTDQTEERAFQICRKFMEFCMANGVSPQHAAMDSTGAGSPMCDILSRMWSPAILRVHFGGKASELPVSATNPKLSKELYYDRVTELWYSGKQWLTNNQLRGIDPMLAREMTSRKYGTTGADKKIYAESKVDMKVRTGYSPDIADAAFIMLDLVRQRLNISPTNALVGAYGTLVPRGPRRWAQVTSKYRMRGRGMPMNLPNPNDPRSSSLS